MENKIVKNTIILIISSMIIRILSLANRIILTRLLGNDGISLYVITLPSLSLFMSIAGFSLNIATSKVIAENSVTKKYSEKKILTGAVIIGLIAAAATIIILLIILKPLVYSGLKQENALYPILACVFFLPLIALNNVYRGYFNGKNRINISAYATVIEQISRIIVSIVLLYVFLPYGLIVAVSMAILAMGIGEIISLGYVLIMIKKDKPQAITNANQPTKALLKITVPTTASRLVGNFTFFLEPIIYTAALSLIGLSSKDILYRYSAITAYAIPLITLCSFVSTSIATAVIPNISRSYAAGNIDQVNYYIKKSCLLSIVPGILVSVLITTYARDYMMLVYRTEIGADYVEKIGAFFILFYLLAPLGAIMQAVGRAKTLFRYSLITNIIKLALIFGLTFIPWISFDSLLIAMLINTFMATALLYFYLKNTFKFKFYFGEIFNIVLLIVLTVLSLHILKAGISNYLLNTVILSFLFWGYTRLLKIASLRNK